MFKRLVLIDVTLEQSDFHIQLKQLENPNYEPHPQIIKIYISHEADSFYINRNLKLKNLNGITIYFEDGDAKVNGENTLAFNDLTELVFKCDVIAIFNSNLEFPKLRN